MDKTLQTMCSDVPSILNAHEQERTGLSLTRVRHKGWEFKHEFQLRTGLGRASSGQSHADKIHSFQANSLDEDIIKAFWREGHLIYSGLKQHVLHIVIMMLILLRIHTKCVTVTAALCPMPAPSLGVSFMESASGDSRWRWVILGWN